MNITKIYFTDAYYRTGERGEFGFVRGEAYGFCDERKSELRLHFIRRVRRTPFFLKGFLKNYFLKGLIIPKAALRAHAFGFEGQLFTLGKEIKIRWADMVHVENMKRKSFSTMETQGEVALDEKNLVVIKNPKTTRLTLPKKKHPEVDPDYYSIPKALILGSSKEVNPETLDELDENQVSLVIFIKNGVEYECAGVLFEKGEKTRVAFSAIDGEIVDFLDLDADEILRLEPLKSGDIVQYG